MDEKTSPLRTTYDAVQRVQQPGGAGTFKAALASAPSVRPKRRAVLVTHGMGQQQPFDTLVMVAEALLSEAERHGRSVAEAKPTATRVKLGTEELSRIDMALVPGAEVHVYEGYWAPLTEGRVALTDVMRFLYGAGTNGLLRASRRSETGRRVFQRWVFGRLRDYPVPRRNLLQLVGTLLLILALVAMNGVIAAVTASQALGVSGVRGAGAWPSDALLLQLSGLFHIELFAGVLFGLLLAAASKTRRALVHWLTRAWFWLLAAITLATGFGSGLLIALEHVAMLAPLARVSAPLRAALACLGFGEWRVYLVSWPVFVLLSAAVRNLMVQYVGDVAAYVSSHQLDRFAEIRAAIRERVGNTARAIYGARDDAGAFLYDSVAIVGHSLGSVVSYDILNAMLSHDALQSAASFEARTRTNILLTFGSPLDKIAFVFGSRDEDDVMPGRSALTAAAQPLVLDELYNSIPWVNVYSPNDVISGELSLYQLPKGDGSARIQNHTDPAALTWIAAHTVYWKTREVWRHLYAALSAP